MNQVKISKNVKTPIQPGMFGLFFEDINYAADGGLYAEMLENRNFEFQESRGYYDHYSQDFDGLYGWSACSGQGKLALDTQKPQNEVNPHYLHFTAMAAGDGFTNKAYDGICLNKGRITASASGPEHLPSAARYWCMWKRTVSFIQIRQRSPD